MPVIQDLVHDLSTRTARAFLSDLSPSSAPLRYFLRGALEGWGDDAFLSEPVLEAKYPFAEAPWTMGQLAVEDTLDERLVAAMDAPPEALAAQRFGRDWHPYTHQIAAWERLRAGRSIVVSSGTGSGKTECFLAPILDDLVRQGGDAPLEGVQALFLYPLNALINSQQERLSAWTRAFGGRVRYCLYNGETPENIKKATAKTTPEQVRSRIRLRESPPPLLVTNATMLEYMLVRPQDQPILARSKGKLRYIVLDEAHTYVGSQAAELSLLLRRVMEAFAVKPEEVRFIATSATISSSDGGEAGAARAEANLKAFLGSLSGQGPGGIDVITGRQEPPPLHGADAPTALAPDLDALPSLDPAARYAALAASRAGRRLRAALIEEGPRTLGDLASKLREDLGGVNRRAVLKLLDAGHTARHPGDEVPFLPLRAHFFVRTSPGLWACVDPACAARAGTALAHDDWPFGKVYTHLREACDCGARVFELKLCANCGEGWLEARRKLDVETGATTLHPTSQGHLFRLEELDSLDEGITAEDDAGDGGDGALLRDLLLLGRADLANAPETLDPKTGHLGAPGPAFSTIDPGAEGEMGCLRCRHPRRGDRDFHRAARTGSLFTLGTAVPALLERTPTTDGPERHQRPFEGRRTLTFTDSRQGSARFAARLQGEAERGYVRSFLYAHLLHNGGVDEAALAEKRRQLADLKALPPNPVFAPIMAGLEADIAALERPKAFAFKDLVGSMVNDGSFAFIHEYRRKYDPFQLSPEQLSELLILREFARRPARRASLETLGLVELRYSALEGVPPNPPDAWKALGGTPAGWTAFLRICIDFFVRAYAALAIPRDYFRWMGTEIRLKTLVRFDEARTGRRQPWPQHHPGRVNRLVRLLQRVFALDLDDGGARSDINEILKQAWNTLIARGAFASEDDGYRLDIRGQLMLAPLRRAWLCPVSRGLLGVTLRGHTPYQPALPPGAAFSTTCEPVDMPSPPFARGRLRATGEKIADDEVRAWLESDPAVVAAREAGAWSEFSDRIACFRDYYRVAEHSAQLHSTALKANEAAFKAAKINILSCSTTMEMGVDIGQLKAVALNNAPPSPANFLQRVGRAGRRKEALSLSLTVCRSMPHDQLVFRNPTWPFTAPVSVPEVRLDSARIVERHLAALCLTRSLKAIDGIEPGAAQPIPKLEAGWLFRRQEGADDAPSDRFLVELAGWSASPPAGLADALGRLVRGSALERFEPRELILRVEESMRRVQDAWRQERAVLDDELAAIPEADRETAPAALAIARRMRRMDGEYLLSTLADRQFLPGYGFPTGVLPFVTDTAEELIARRRQRARAGAPQREDRRGRKYPSRDLPMAIREYAPGARVVLDGRVYVSGGVTLNWKYQPSEEGSDKAPQDFKAIWSCGTCGEVVDRAQAEGGGACDACGGAMRVQPYMVPAGFAVDIRYRAEVDPGYRTFIPVERPRISMGSADFQTLGAPVIGRWRHADDGEVFSLSLGERGLGYAICLACGRAASEYTDREAGAGPESLPPALRGTDGAGHRRLRGGRGDAGRGEGPALCQSAADATGFSIKRHQALGGSRRTDAFELQLRHPVSGRLPDEKVALTLAVVLRDALAEKVGVEAGEIRYAATPRRWEEEGWGILLYDDAAGGAGFCAQAPQHLPALLRRAVEKLGCPRACTRACDHCLLGFDTQHDLAKLDRNAALAFLSRELMDALQLPEDHRRFGEGSQVEWLPPTAALLRQVRRLGGDAVRLFVGGGPTDWDFGHSAAWGLLHRLRELPAEVSLVFPPGGLAALDWQRAGQLAGLAELTGVSLVEADRAEPAGTPQRLFAEVDTPGGTAGFSSDDLRCAIPGPGWLEPLVGQRVVRGAAASALDGATCTPIALDTLRKPPPGHYKRLDINPVHVKGPANRFGDRFLRVLSALSPEIKARLETGEVARAIRYTDRYLVSPDAVANWYSLMEALRRRGVLARRETSVALRALRVGLRPPRDSAPSMVFHNWQNETRHQEVLESLLQSVANTRTLVIARSKEELPHFRSLEIRWDGGARIELILDQGLGFLRADRQHFPFGTSADHQVSRILSGSWKNQVQPPGRDTVGYLKT